MNVDDFLNQVGSYNQDADTITGFFNLDDDATEEKLKEVAKVAKEVDTKSEIMIKIDSVTESKIEAIVLASLFTEAVMKHAMSGESDMHEALIPMKIAMALSMCVGDDIMTIDDAEKVSEVFAKVFSSL